MPSIIVLSVSRLWLWSLEFLTLSRFYLFWIYFSSFAFFKGIFWKSRSLVILVEFSFLYAFLIFLKLHMFLKISSLRDIIAVDFPHRINCRFELVYVFWCFDYQFPLILKMYVSDKASILSVASFFRSSFWLEREIWDMFGLKFIFHANLRRILTDFGFIGYPLRKDFPLVGFIETRYEDLLQSVVLEPVALLQSYRFFRSFYTWGNWI